MAIPLLDFYVILIRWHGIDRQTYFIINYCSIEKTKIIYNKI